MFQTEWRDYYLRGTRLSLPIEWNLLPEKIQPDAAFYLKSSAPRDKLPYYRCGRRNAWAMARRF